MYAFCTRFKMDETGQLRLSELVTTYNLNNSSHLSSSWRSCSDKVIVLFCVFRYSSYVCTWTERTSSETVCNRVSVYATGSRTHSSFSPLTHTHTPKLITLTCSSPQLLATLRSECSIPPPECFEVDPTDTTQEVKKSPVKEAGPAHSMEQVNPQHLGTYVHYTSCHVFTAKHHYTRHYKSLLVCVAICIYS